LVSTAAQYPKFFHGIPWFGWEDEYTREFVLGILQRRPKSDLGSHDFTTERLCFQLEPFALSHSKWNYRLGLKKCTSCVAAVQKWKDERGACSLSQPRLNEHGPVIHLLLRFLSYVTLGFLADDTNSSKSLPTLPLDLVEHIDEYAGFKYLLDWAVCIDAFFDSYSMSWTNVIDEVLKGRNLRDQRQATQARHTETS